MAPARVTRALVDCPDHEPNGEAALAENVASHGVPVATHNTDGRPTFAGWRDHDSLTHENVYYKWLERTYRAGLRVFVMLAVDNSALCMVNPYELQDFIDAKHGDQPLPGHGPGLQLGRPRGNGSRLVYGVRAGRVSWVGVASRSASRSPKRLASYRRATRIR